MRKWSWILGAFLMAAGCEDSTPPKKAEPIVQMATPTVEAPKIVEQPKIVEKIEPPKVEVVDEEGDEDMKPSEAIAGARDAMSEGKLDRALKLAKVGVLKVPNRSAAWNTLGRVQLTRGERKDAHSSFEKAVELNPKSSYAQNNLGLTLIYEGKFAEAIDALEEATDLEPVEPYMWNNLGMAYEHVDRLEEARDAYQKAAELKSDRAHENLARLEGVKSVMRTAKIDKMPTEIPATDGGN